MPLFTVLFVTLSAFPAFQEWRADIEASLFKNFVPALGDQIRDYLLQFADKAKGLQAAGIVVLFVTVLAMMSTIESTFNVIWGIRRKRPLVVRFLVYWAMLTLGPLFIGAGMVATSYVISLPLLSEASVTVGLKTRLIGAFPVIATTFAFVLFFKLIPYRPVPFRHALVGGVVASVLFELAKCGFAFLCHSLPRATSGVWCVRDRADLSDLDLFVVGGGASRRRDHTVLDDLSSGRAEYGEGCP